jgi:hypothetical protein
MPSLSVLCSGLLVIIKKNLSLSLSLAVSVCVTHFRASAAEEGSFLLGGVSFLWCVSVSVCVCFRVTAPLPTAVLLNTGEQA